MSKRIDHIIEVLTEIKERFTGAKDISTIRLQATELVAKRNKVIRNTIFDTITRQLEPEITTVAQFEAVTLDWLSTNSQTLHNIIKAHCSDEGDIKQVNTFFDLSSLDWVLDSDIGSTEKRSYKEGASIQIAHFVKERNKTLIKDAKDHWRKQYGHISCTVCGFNFVAVYGERGLNYIEAHHNKPLAEITEETEFVVEDLSPLCSNCHRMIHRKLPWLSIDQLKKILKR